MSTAYADYLDKSTRKIIGIISDPDVEDTERENIVSELSDELLNNIWNPGKLRDCDLLAYSVSANHIDSKLSGILSDSDAGYTDYDTGIKLCGRQRNIVRMFNENKWVLPDLNNMQIDDCERIFKDRLEKCSISSKIIDEDKKIEKLIGRAQNELSISLCDEALKLLEQLNKDIEICRQKNYLIPEIANIDTNKSEKRISDIRKTAEKKDELCQHIYNNDTQIHNIASLSESTHEQWQEVITLCNNQAELLKKCQKQQWSLPNIKYSDPDKTANKYKHYQTLIKLDSAISTEKTSLKTEKQYNIFFDNCSKQQTNIEICNKNEWSVPVLNNPNPLEILDAVRADKHKMDMKRSFKKGLILTCSVIICILVLCITFRFIYIKDKVQIPFDDSYISGQNYDVIRKEFENAGFQNVQLDKPFESGWGNSGVVIGVSIDNSDTYKKGKHIDPKTKVVITYYSEDRVPVTDLLKDWKNTDYNIIEQNFRNEGFSDITIEEKDTFEKDNDKKTAGLFLNGIEYKANEECYLPLNAPIVISYYNLKIEIGATNAQFIGRNYEDLKSDLEEMGFKNVATLKIDKGWAKGNTVIGVTVDGSETYYSSTAFLPDAKVIIKYSSNDRINITKCFENLDEVEYTSVQNALKAMGLTNIKITTEDTNFKSQNQRISSIIINNERYTGGDCHVQKTVPIEIKYYVLSIKIEKSASDFEKEQYSDVVADLKEKGFTNIQLKRADNLLNGVWTKEGSIKSVTIGGNEKFTDEAKFIYDAPIVIVVNTFKGKGCEDITDIA